jgi:DNA-binding transcriptional LysR family regulator
MRRPPSRGVVLTPQAEILVAHTEALLERLERAETELAASLTDISGVVCVAAFQSAAHALIPETVTWLAERHPALCLRITEMDPEQALPALVARDFDLVLGEEYPGHPHPPPAGAEFVELVQDPIHLARPAASVATRPRIRSLLDLADQPWVMEPEGTPPRQWSTALCRGAGFEPDVRFESTDLRFHLRLVETGHATALVPDLARRADDDVHFEPVPGHPTRRVFIAIRRGAGERPAIQAVRDGLRHATERRITTST